MVEHVKAVAVLMIAVGALYVLASVGVFAFALLGYSGSAQDSSDDVMLVVCVVISFILFGLGGVTIAAGIRCLTFQNRVFILVVLFAHGLAVFTGICSLTSVGLMVYGLVVLFDA